MNHAPTIADILPKKRAHRRQERFRQSTVALFCLAVREVSGFSFIRWILPDAEPEGDQRAEALGTALVAVFCGSSFSHGTRVNAQAVPVQYSAKQSPWG